MTDTIELAKQCGAMIGVKHILDVTKEGIFFSPEELEAFRQACVKEAVPESAYCAAGVEPCACAVANNLDATRYRFLRDQNIDKDFPRSGVFIGSIPDNVCLTGKHADEYIDKAMLAAAPEVK